MDFSASISPINFHCVEEIIKDTHSGCDYLNSQSDSDLVFTGMPFVKAFGYVLTCTHIYVCYHRKHVTLCTIDSNSIQLCYIFNLFSYMHAIYIFHTMSYFTDVILCF